MARVLERSISLNKICAFIIGIGIALTPIHNSWLTDLVTSDNEVGFFIPSFGIALWFIGSLMFINYNWGKLDWGDKKIYIPLLVIVVAIGLSGINGETWGERVSPFFLGASLFALYIACRTLGKDIFIPLAVGAAIASVGVIIHGIVHPGKITGGYLFEDNYDIVVGYVLLGLALFMHKWRWLLVGLSLIAMIVTGSPEAVFATSILIVAIVWKRDWGLKAIAIGGILVIVIITGLGLGYGKQLYTYTGEVLVGAANIEQEGLPDGTNAVKYRISVAGDALRNLKPLGEGYNLTEFSKMPNVHNVPLIIVQQLGWPGILAGIAWLWVTIYCLIKTRWKYAWLMIIALSVFDHYLWTQMTPVWWALIGVSATSDIKTDLIFKKPKIEYDAVIRERFKRIVDVAKG